jgi:predicted dehydrogenase/threonine dehydrogenase-like Zn-dependent dehydrogenase
MLVEFGNASLIQKARQQPDKVMMVLNKIRSDGLVPTLEAVFNKLGQPLPLGYCNVGRVIAVGSGVTDLHKGDRVVSNGAHAEIVCVPVNLCAKVPDGVSDDDAAFTVIGAIGLQGIRLLEPTFGETVSVIGLGLIGLLAAQLLRANGCHVIGFDLDQRKVDLANSLGIQAINPGDGTDQVKYVLDNTGGVGADAVLVTAATKSNAIISAAAKMCRKRARIVLVGTIGLDISRADFYEKELRFQVSCSYGPGRYDEDYEQHGQDYPIGFVRWTEKRNFDAVLAAIGSGGLEVGPLISERVPLDEFNRIYSNISDSTSIGSLLVYNDTVDDRPTTPVSERSFSRSDGVIGLIGAGNYTSATVLPALAPTGAQIKYIVSASGLTARTLASRAGIANAASDYKVVLADDDIDLVIITTRHNLHASMVIESLQAGKNVFVEKPLCLSESELTEILAALANVGSGSGPLLTVGFNRRFAPAAQKMKSLLGDAPLNIVATMNAGFIPPDSWVHDLRVGGGRIVGEACHFIDMCCFLAGSPVVAVCMNALGLERKEETDNASILLRHANGSNAVINYLANGNKAYAKERIEVHSQERSLILDNWRTLKGYGFSEFNSAKSRQDKGHAEQFRILVDRIKSGGEPLIPIDEIVNATRAGFCAMTSLRENRWVDVPTS